MHDFILPKNWFTLFGDFEFKSDYIQFKGTEYSEPRLDDQTSQPDEKRALTGLAMCEIPFGSGTVAFEVESSHTDYIPAIQAVLVRNPETDARIAAGFSSQESYSNFTVNEFQLRPGEGRQPGWIAIHRSGSLVRKPDERVALEIELLGSTVEIRANDIVVLRGRIPGALPTTQCGIFCQSKSEVRIFNFRVRPARRRAFVVMHFNSPYDDIYKQVIRPVASNQPFNLNVTRADETDGPGLIIADIVRSLFEADIVIAEVTPQNENVFYELGFSHGIGKPTILIADRTRKLPFDVSPFRTLFYDNTIAGKQQIEEGLRKHLSAILSIRQ